MTEKIKKVEKEAAKTPPRVEDGRRRFPKLHKAYRSTINELARRAGVSADVIEDLISTRGIDVALRVVHANPSKTESKIKNILRWLMAWARR